MMIKNWSAFQHYKHRNPPWIKLHSRLLNDRAFMALSCASRGLLMLLWILASEDKGRITMSEEDLCFRLRIDSIDLQPLFDSGFLIDDDDLQADASTEQAKACRETETETERERETLGGVQGGGNMDESIESLRSKLGA